MRQFSVALIAAALGLGAAGAAHAAPATYKIDDDHTYATFAIDHFGASVNRARFDTVTGTVQFDKAAKAGKIDVTVDVKSVRLLRRGQAPDDAFRVGQAGVPG